MKTFQLLTIALLCTVFVASAGNKRRPNKHKNDGDRYDMDMTTTDAATTETTGIDNTATTDDMDLTETSTYSTSSTWHNGDKSDSDSDSNHKKGKKDCWGKRRRRKKGNGRGKKRYRKDCDDDDDWWPIISSTWANFNDTSEDYFNDTNATYMDTTDATDTTNDISTTTTSTTEEECPPILELDPATSPCKCWEGSLLANCPIHDGRCEIVDGLCESVGVFAPMQADDGGVESGGFEAGTHGTTASIIGGAIAAAVIILCLVIGGILCVRKGNKYDNIAAVDECGEGIEFGQAMPMETGGSGETGKTHTIIKYQSSDDEDADNNALIDGNNNYTK